MIYTDAGAKRNQTILSAVLNMLMLYISMSSTVLFTHGPSICVEKNKHSCSRCLEDASCVVGTCDDSIFIQLLGPWANDTILSDGYFDLISHVVQRSQVCTRSAGESPYFKYPHTEGLQQALTHKLKLMKKKIFCFISVINVNIITFTRRKKLVIFLSNEL